MKPFSFSFGLLPFISSKFKVQSSKVKGWNFFSFFSLFPLGFYLARLSRSKAHWAFAVPFTFYLSSCTSDPLSPGVEFMPDMYRSPSYETYGINELYSDSMAARKPVEGTIPRGFTPYANPDNNEGYAAADSNRMPVGMNTTQNMEEGKRLYGIYCSPCHGASGMGDGLVAAKLPGPPPAYSSPQLKNLSEGKMFHSITYGKNLMGPHASQLSSEQRWKIVTYIKTLQNPGGAVADTTASKK